MNDLIESNLGLLRQGLELLERVDASAYRDPAPGRSSVGAQYRHVLDHYRALLEGFGPGRVDYDARRRNPEIETDREVAARDTRDLMDGLAALAGRPLDTPLAAIAACSAHQPGEPQQSSLGRELQFLLSHTVHHYAIVKLLLDRSECVAEEFGVAPSTLAWNRTAG
jgi:uncharacterized damage-inducible protein DinB